MKKIRYHSGLPKSQPEKYPLPSLRSRLFQRVMRLFLPRLSNGRPVQESRERLGQIVHWTWFLTNWVDAQQMVAKGVTCEFITPKNGVPGHAVLYLHGGGYTICSPATHRNLAGRIAKTAQAYTLVPDYRLAPEHPFPAALEDALACWDWLIAQGYPEKNISLGGDSAGGGLALALTFKLRDAGRPLPSSIVLLSPWVDLSEAGEYARLYLTEGDLRNPLVSPLFGDLRGLPPILLHAGGDDFLLQDSVRLAKAINDQDGDVEFKQWAGLFHVFQAFAPFFPEAGQAISEIGAFIRSHFSS
jgi:monoterpene epsilon-lactone hydrolase